MQSVSSSVGRVLTRTAKEDHWSIRGQCVCVVHERIMLTAAHVCFQNGKPLQLRVVYTSTDANYAYKTYQARPMHVSARLDVAVLLLELTPGLRSHFLPVDLAPVGSPLLEPLEAAVLSCFPLAFELNAHGDAADLPLAELHSTPALLQGTIAQVQQQTRPKGGELDRRRVVAFTSYQSWSGCSGGGVFARYLDPRTGKAVLLGVHTHAVYQDNDSEVTIADWPRHSEAEDAAEKKQKTESPAPPASPVSSGSNNSIPSDSPDKTPQGTVLDRLAALEKAFGAYKTESAVFVVADSVTSQPKWSPQELVSLISTMDDSTPEPQSASSNYRVRLRPRAEMKQQGGPRFLKKAEEREQLYDGADEE